MKQDLQEFSLLRKKELVNKLIDSDYAFAAWRMPNAEEVELTISLSGCNQIEVLNLSDIGTGFIVNSYENSHPVTPFFIPSDLHIRKNKQTINPIVSNELVDKFIGNMSNSNNDSSSKTVFTSASKNKYSETFANAVTESIQQIKSGQFEKVVLSRFKDELLQENFNVWDYFEKLCDQYQNAFCSLTYIPGKGVWVGASPELLISETNESFHTVALASTKKLEQNQQLSEIALTQKEIEEQALVSRYVINCFKKLRLREFHEHGPKTIKAGSLAHLKTTFEVKYEEVHFERLADQMVELLHPTSAVCGTPMENSKAWISKKENYDREFYSGFLGPVNHEGVTDLFVNLRCAKIHNGMIRFYAGAGITEDSNPQKEFEETEMKMDVLRNLL